MDKVMTTNDVADALGCHKTTAWRLLRKYGHRMNEDAPRSRYWIGQSEFDELQKAGKMKVERHGAHIPGETHDEYMKRYRRMRKEARLCQNCGNPLPENYEYGNCPDCRAYLKKLKDERRFSDSYKCRVRYNTRKRAGVCTGCKKELPEGWPHVQCEDCRKRAAENQKLWKKRKAEAAREKGVCMTCGRVMEGGDTHLNCCVCRDKKAVKYRMYYHQRYLERKGKA